MSIERGTADEEGKKVIGEKVVNSRRR